MNKLVVLDYCNGSVDIYDIQKPIEEVDDEYIDSLGFRVNDCEYMAVNEPLMTFHREVLK